MRKIIPYLVGGSIALLLLAVIIGTISFKFAAIGAVTILVWFYLFNLIKKHGSDINGF